MDTKKIIFWIRFVLLNLSVLAFVGLILRYKIVFSLSWIDQKHLLHGHSHFAFSGWVTHALMLLLIHVTGVATHKPRIINRLLWLNILCSFGMLFSFAVQGYGAISITFSTASIILGYVFCVLMWRQSGALHSVPARWLLRTALVCHVVSSIGAFSLAVMMATHTVHQNWYLAAVYFFLHFEYNGWFILSLLAIFFEKFHELSDSKSGKKLAATLAICAFPTYFLSTLWMKLPIIVYIVVVLTAILQLVAWFRILAVCYNHRDRFKALFPGFSCQIFIIAALAMSIKVVLQCGSTIPALSNWAFGFRPIVIGYLHLVLLGVVSLGILAMMSAQGMLPLNNRVKKGIIIFTSGIVFNELLLLIQGIGAVSMNVVPLTNELLIAAAATMFAGALFTALSVSPEANTE